VPATTAAAAELFVSEEGSAEQMRRTWSALDEVRSVPTTGPDGKTLLSAWERLDELHAVAAAVAFRTLGLPYRVGESFDPARAAQLAEIPARYTRWLNRAAGALCAHGYLSDGPDGLVVSRELPAEIPESVAEDVRHDLTGTLNVAEDVTEWFLSVVRNLAGVLSQSVHSAELYANDRTPGVYARLFGPTYDVVAEALRRLVGSWPQEQSLRVLEVGSGYGSLTRHLLPLLPEDRTEYVFTDISTFFLGQARNAFAEYPFMRYELLDLDRAPETQGFDEHVADVIIAASVLHDAKRIAPTLRHLRSMLAPDGLLVIVEQTALHPWFDLTMGLQQGFDGFEDTELRSLHPLLDREQWEAQLAAAGFADTTVLTETGGPAAVGFDVIVARGPSQSKRFDQEVLRGFLAERLPKHMVPARIRALHELPLSRTGKIDRAALSSRVTAGSLRTAPPEPPRTERQRQLVDIWRLVLGLDEVGITDDFLEAGGDSLLAARLVASIKASFGIVVPVSVVLEYSTVEKLDGYLDQVLADQPATVELEAR
jgi:pyochelin synthetase